MLNKELDIDAYERVKRQTDDPLGVSLTMSIKLHNNGAMSIEGPIADKKFCKLLLDEAWEAIKRQHSNDSKIIIPNNDVDSKAKDNYLCHS